ncbi:UNVERIFIED_CONTAM: putative mitochondrial protein [Sesamum calycinum]|uniref:Mitochondrial protein n=1 Tax=Sesamum calycinum TaxID=2727403 RepID=A0AAW2L5P9_9LAMI
MEKTRPYVSDAAWLEYGQIPPISVRYQAPLTTLHLYSMLLMEQRKLKGDLTDNVRLAKSFLDKAQELFAAHRTDFLLQLVKCCRLVYSVAIKLEASMLRQRAKLQWLKHGDQNSRIFFRQINTRRARQRVFQIMKANGEVHRYDAVTEEFVSSFKTGTITTGINLSFLQQDLNILNICFADDVLLFCKAHFPSTQLFKDTLCELLSLLTVNPAKSQIILSRAAQQDKQQMLDLLGFQEGRTLLIKSVLCTLHAYWASVFILPKGIIKIIEARIRKFLWQGSNGRGYAKVAWEQVCKTKEEGGLGIRRITVTNQALMLKHLWKLVQMDRSSIWVEWILQYRLRNATIWSFTGASGSWGWKKMLKLRPILKSGKMAEKAILSSFGRTFGMSMDHSAFHIQGGRLLQVCQLMPLFQCAP